MRNEIPKHAHAMIIGAMKCGTTSFYHYLEGHPEICAAVTKEPEFFSEHQRHGARAERYGDLFPFDGSVHKYTLEASTGYTKYPMEPNVPRNIVDYGLEPRFIYLVRNPFDRIVSHFNFMRGRPAWTHGIVDQHLVDTSNYFLQLSQYRRYFPRERILVVDFEDLKMRPRAVVERAYRFLGLSIDHFPKTYACRNVMSGGQPHEKRLLTEKEWAFVFDALKDDMARFGGVYGFDVGNWGFS